MCRGSGRKAKGPCGRVRGSFVLLCYITHMRLPHMCPSLWTQNASCLGSSWAQHWQIGMSKTAQRPVAGGLLYLDRTMRQLLWRNPTPYCSRAQKQMSTLQAPSPFLSSSLYIQRSLSCLSTSKGKRICKHYWDTFRFRCLDQFLLYFFKSQCFVLSLSLSLKSQGLTDSLSPLACQHSGHPSREKMKLGDMSFFWNRQHHKSQTLLAQNSKRVFGEREKPPWNTRTPTPTIKYTGQIKQSIT